MKHPVAVFFLAVVLALAALPSLHAQRTPQTSTIVLASSAAEYPPFDVQVQQAEERGLSAKLVAVRIARSLDDPDTVVALLARQRVDAAVDVALQIASRHPESITRLLRSLPPVFALTGGNRQKWIERMPDVIAAAHKRLPDLPKADAAEAAYLLLNLESELDRTQSDDRVERLKAFVQEFAGTDAALNAELDLINVGGTTPARFAALDAFMRGHPGSCASARALHQKAVTLGFNVTNPKEDPTDRFLQVIELARQLESEPYRPCEWVAKATDLVVNFHAYKPDYAEGNVDRMLEAYRTFAKSHFVLDERDPATYGVGYMLRGMMVTELHARKGDGVAGIEADLEAIEKEVPDRTGARYLRASFLMNRMRELEAGAEQTAVSQKAAALLADIHATATGVYQRKSLATLASLHMYLSDYANARAAYAKYVELYPASPYAWVAAIRIGMCDERGGQWANAIGSYRQALQSYSAVPPVRFVGNVYMARAHEALGEVELARISYARALDAWDSDYGAKFSLQPWQATGRMVGFEIRVDTAEVSREALVVRLAELTRTAAAPGGVALERGRWMLTHGQRTAAIAALEQVAKDFPKSANLAEARYLVHQARLEDALDRANSEKPGGDAGAAMKALEALANEAPDFAVSAAKITRACLLALQGNGDESRRIMLDALKELQARQKVEISRGVLTLIEQDVAAIREAIVKPTGDLIYGTGRWNAFSWPATLPPFVIVNSRVLVKFPDGQQMPVTLNQRFAQIDSVVLLDPDQIAFFSGLVTSLGGTKKRQPTGVMETPNQPVGRSIDVGRFLNTFFPVRPGHWGGWEFLTYPVVSRIEFVNEERTKARASVIIGYSGADVILEKTNGVWKAVGLDNQWVT